jgi:hypothetical protein
MDVTQVDFFAVHPDYGWLMLGGLALFPRITLLFVGGHFDFLHWLGWVICPHVLVAIMATTKYWATNKLLCIIAWFFAFAGTGSEGRIATHRRWRREERRRRKEERRARRLREVEV